MIIARIIIRIHQITVKLYRKGASGWQDTLSAAELKLTNGWEDRIVDLPVFENPQYQDVTHIGSSTQIQYKLEELADEAIQANFTGSSEEFTLIAGTQPTEEKMINTLKTVSVCVQKKWEDSQDPVSKPSGQYGRCDGTAEKD